MTDATTISTNRLVLRRPNSGDVPALTDFYVSKRSQYAGGFVPRAKAWSNAVAMLGHWQVHNYGLWAVTTKGDDTALGLVGPYYPDGRPEKEIGWVLFEGAEGRGIAFEAARATLKHAYDVLNWDSIVSYIAPENARSIALAQKLGAKRDIDAAQPDPSKPCLVFRHDRDEVFA